MTRDEWKAVEEVLHKPDVQLAMRGRCEEQGHEMESGLTLAMRFVLVCKWCGKTK